MVIDHFNSDSERILSELESYPNSLFLYLKTIVEVHLSGTLNFTRLTKSDMSNVPNWRSENVHMKRLKAYLEKVSDFPKFLRTNPVDVTDNLIERYLEVATCTFTSIKYMMISHSSFNHLKLFTRRCLTAYLMNLLHLSNSKLDVLFFLLLIPGLQL